MLISNARKNFFPSFQCVIYMYEIRIGECTKCTAAKNYCKNHCLVNLTFFHDVNFTANVC